MSEFNIQFDPQGLKDLEQRLNPDRLAAALRAALDASSIVALNEVRLALTPHVKTGRTRASFSRKVISPDRQSIGSNHPPARYLEYGTKPHMIFPRNKRALRFSVGGRIVFSKFVSHPGTKAYGYLAGIKQNKSGVIQQIFSNHLNQLLAGQ